ncbi:MSC_0619 family F1-like ATPase alpha subunit [Candidatus Mycoplasma pogonae]
MKNNPKIYLIHDHILVVRGKYPYKQEQFFEVKNKPHCKAFLLSAKDDEAFLILSGKSSDYEIGDELIEIKDYGYVKTSQDYFGNVININGEIILPQPKEKINFDKNSHSSYIFATAENMMSRKRLNKQLYTGFLAIDLFNPIGLGQREVILGNKKTGKTFIALNTIINQKHRNIKCIYVSIGNSRNQINEIYSTLEKYNALKNTIIIEASPASPFEQYLAPYIGMAHAENLAKENDVLIIIDDLTTHANIFREAALLIDKPIGKEAFPGDIFFAHSRILEKSGKFINSKSITCLPIVKIIDDDITGLIASNIISITDGQIILDSKLFAQGKLPAVNLDISVSRTGTSVQSKNVAKVSTKLIKIYREYKRQEKLAILNYELNEDITKILFKGKAIEGLLNQKGIQSYNEETVLIITQIIAWGLLQNVTNKSEALKFIYSLIRNDEKAKQSYQMLLNGEDVNQKLMRNYFAKALNQFFDYKKYDLAIPLEMDFVDIDQVTLEAIINQMEEQ